MNILNVLNYSPEFGGGVPKHLLALGKMCTERGDKLSIAFPKERQWQKELIKNADVLIMPEILNPLWSGYSKVIRNYCKKYSIDVIHIHFTFAQNLALALSLKPLNLPVIHHWHNPPVALNNFLTPENKLKGIMKRIVSGFVARFADNRVINMHISMSKEITRLLLKHKWTIESKMRLIPNGVEFIPSEVTFKNKISDRPVIGTVANFRPQKDHQTLIKAFKILIDKGVDCELWLVGDGPTKSEIEKLTQDLGIQSNVRFWGLVMNPSDLYKQMDVFVLSTHYEGHPLVALEAMSYGLPIVATKISSVPEVIEDNFNGMLFNPGDPAHLARTLIKLLEDKNLFMRISNTSFETVKTLPSMDDWARNVLDVYEQTLKKYNN